MGNHALPQELTRGYSNMFLDALVKAEADKAKVLTRADLDALDAAEEAAA